MNWMPLSFNALTFIQIADWMSFNMYSAAVYLKITRSDLFSFALIICTILVSFCEVAISFFTFFGRNLLQYKMTRRHLVALKHA
jgi:hypothetical protein